MHQGYVKDADRLNAQLDRYAEDPRYQQLFIDLVCYFGVCGTDSSDENVAKKGFEMKM